MLIGARQRLSTLTVSPTATINGALIGQATITKSLGVLFNDKLNWSSHIDELTKKIASGIGAIKRVRHLVPLATLHFIYRAPQFPHSWGNCGITLQHTLQKLQNRAARVLTFSNYDTDAELLGWKNLTC